MTDNSSSIKPLPEQESVIDAVAGSSNVMVQAYAGCAKSTTLVMAAPRVKVPALGLAFNKRIATELTPRMPGNFTIKTLNGLGHGAWARALPPSARLLLENRKLGKLVTETCKDRKVELSGDQWSDVRGLVTKAMNAGITPGNQGSPLAFDEPEAWAALAEEMWMTEGDFHLLGDIAHDVLERSVALARQGTISFDDQVYASVCLGGKFPQYPVVFVDEAQDLSPLNHRMLELVLRPGGRLVAVGDPKQCHPPGTQILLTGGQTRVIEEIKVGDKLVSYNRSTGFSGANHQGTTVTAVKSFNFSGELIRIITESFSSHECTPNHRCLVKWTDKQGYALYLMKKGNHFRIGNAQNWYKSSDKGGFGPSMRARQEDADALWILDVFETKEQALIQEKVIWTLFGLPDLIFKCSGKASSTQAHLDNAWSQIGDNSARAQACLKHFHRQMEFPLWIKGESKHIGDKTMLIQACNIVSGAMAVRVFGESDWIRCWIDYAPYNGAVIGITVDSNGYGMNLYVANGIVTHNSIYAFRGADHNSMPKLRSMRSNWEVLPLTTTFRCPKAIVARQQGHAPGFRAWHTNAEGIWHRFRSPGAEEGVALDDGWRWVDVLEKLPAPTASLAVLCRNNGPLLSLAMKLIRQRVGVVMLGRDIGKGLISLSRKLVPDDAASADSVRGVVEEWRRNEVAIAVAAGHEEKVTPIEDRADCLIAVLDGAECRDAGQLRAILTDLFSRDSGQVTLSSIHRAKGLEWDCVVHLDPWRVPSAAARRAARAGDPRALEQELNLRYVCETRTRHTLLEASLDGWVDG